MTGFSGARRRLEGDGWLDELARASLFAAEAKFDQPPLEAVLRVDVASEIDARVHEQLTRALQDATARVGHALADSGADGTRLTEDDRHNTPLYPRRMIGRTLEFGFVSLDQLRSPDDQLLNFSDTPTRSEIAVRELIDVLPEAASDEVAISALPGRSRAMLNAVSDVARAVAASTDIGLQIEGGRRPPVESVVTRAQASSMEKILRETKESRYTTQLQGRLDGVRTRRRIFFLETDSGDVSGAYEADVSEQVLRHLNRHVEAFVEVIQMESRSGRRGRRTYRLLGITDAPSLFDT